MKPPMITQQRQHTLATENRKSRRSSMDLCIKKIRHLSTSQHNLAEKEKKNCCTSIGYQMDGMGNDEDDDVKENNI